MAGLEDTAAPVSYVHSASAAVVHDGGVPLHKSIAAELTACSTPLFEPTSTVPSAPMAGLERTLDKDAAMPVE